MFPISTVPRLRDVLERQLARTESVEKATGRIIPWLFRRKGRPIKSFRRAWLTACKNAGVPGRIPHDFRRGKWHTRHAARGERCGEGDQGQEGNRRAPSSATQHLHPHHHDPARGRRWAFDVPLDSAPLGPDEPCSHPAGLPARSLQMRTVRRATMCAFSKRVRFLACRSDPVLAQPEGSRRQHRENDANATVFARSWSAWPATGVTGARGLGERAIAGAETPGGHNDAADSDGAIHSPVLRLDAARLPAMAARCPGGSASSRLEPDCRDRTRSARPPMPDAVPSPAIAVSMNRRSVAPLTWPPILACRAGALRGGAPDNPPGRRGNARLS
jgi:hypothetical protein